MKTPRTRFQCVAYVLVAVPIVIYGIVRALLNELWEGVWHGSQTTTQEESPFTTEESRQD